ncbi:hypothetical protein [Limnohabitans sp. TS-CS-82]|uniref:hypothetical protein n=1 Tax=Limnohabitans sp. TS-CS-82 TaxID=2094193 RepID=UPI0011B02DCA|nr:hypothetical protein [Limnohabitans sp. TS-CS-82]
MLKHTYTAQSHRFFDNIVSFIAGISSLGLAFQAQAGLPTHQFGPNDFIAVVGLPHVASCEFHVFPEPVLTALLANQWPTRIVIHEVPINHAPPSHPIWLTGMQGVHGSMIANAFVQYFESNRCTAESKYGSNVHAWPATWNFGRVVRNALSHKGIINIQNSSAAPVTWKTLTYGPAQNGRQLLYQDLTAVEFILLMEEMDSLL